jgi:hypothetical protein
MTRTGCGLLLVTSMFLVGCRRPSQPNFRQLYNRYEQAVRDMDSAAYMRTLTDDFSMVSPDGKVHDREEMKRYLQVNAATTKKVNACSFEIEAVNPAPDGDFAVIVLQKYDREQAPMEEPTKPHKIQTSVVQRETWHRRGGEWKIRRIEELLVGPVYLDGKILQE